MNCAAVAVCSHGAPGLHDASPLHPRHVASAARTRLVEWIERHMSRTPQRRAQQHTVFRRRWLRLLVVVAAAAAGGLALTWYAVHRFEWAGPLVANSLRAVLGAENVARLEDTAYGVEDGINRVIRRGEKPRAYWRVEDAGLDVTQDEAAGEAAEQAELPPFRPKRVGPVHASWSAPGDGEWIPIRDPRWPDVDPLMYKTLLHPDRNRSWAELFVVALDLRRVAIKPRLGTREPAPNVDPEPVLDRPGTIPPSEHERTLAAFNGGFMTEHGKYGMMLDGVTIVKPHGRACTFAKYQDGPLRIASWSRVVDDLPEMEWFRQTPNCMVEAGNLHPVLASGTEKHWGATLDGDTVIRRSAIGLDESGETLYVSISNHTTAKAVAVGMQHVGAVAVAQLDVNWSYPKFVVFRAPAPGEPLQAEALAEGFEFRRGEYLRDKSLRDFFYVTYRGPGVSSAEPSKLGSAEH